MRLVCQELNQFGINLRPFARTHTCGGQEDLFMISLDDMCLAFAQPGDNRIGELVFKDTVAEAQQLVDAAHGLQGEVEPANVAVQIRYDADSQSLPPVWPIESGVAPRAFGDTAGLSVNWHQTREPR